MSENASNNDYFDDLETNPILVDMAETLERETNFDNPEIRTKDLLSGILWSMGTHMLNMYKKRLIECYRIYLTTKYPSQFEVYKKKLEKYEMIDWRDLFSEFPDQFQNDQFLSLIQNFAPTFDDIYNLQKNEIIKINCCFADRKVGKIWFDMIKFVDEHFDDIEKQRNNLRTMKLIINDLFS